MALEELSVEQIISRAYARAIPPSKAIRLALSRSRHGGHEDASKQKLGAALLDHLAHTAPSTLSSSYLAEAFSSGGLDPQLFVIQLLFRLNDKGSLSSPCLVSIASTLPGSSWASATDQAFPATVTDPRMLHPPDIGTSASAVPVDPTTSTLSLILPLLRLCADATDPAPLPITALVVRLLSSLQPYPAPPLEIGLEASGLIPSLPEAISLPLRSCLSGLMADLAISQTAAALNLQAPPIAAGNAAKLPEGEVDFPSLALTFPPDRPTPPIPLPHMISLLLTYALSPTQSSTVSRDPDPAIPPSHLALIRAGRYLASPEAFLLNLIEGSLQLVLGTHQTFTPELQRSMLFVTEWLPGLLRYWKDDTSFVDWPYPSNLVEGISTVFERLAANLTSLSSWITATHATRVSEAENADDGSSFMLVDGWEISSIQAILLRRLVDLGLIDESSAETLLPGQIPPAGVLGESLLHRVSSGSPLSLPVYEATIASTPGAARSFAEEFVAAISASGQLPLPDNLLSNLSSHPTLIMSLTCIIPAYQLLHLCVKHLLDAPADEAVRAEDPQGVLTKFGENVVFIEALVDVFQLELPTLLTRSRRSVSLGHMDEVQRAYLNGWVKALFSTEGIDDQILLSTMPQDLCWLAPSIIHQAISATAAGRLDKDALHGGLSYFSQPLLSWCLGGIISWLSTEVVRNGLISALYLDVLQIILLNDSTPDVLLRVNVKAISRLLDPQAGLSTVFQSAKFDSQAVSARLDRVPLRSQLWNNRPNSALPLNVFRSQLHVIRHLALTQHPWSGPFLADVEDCLAAAGPVAMLQVLYSELVRPSLEFDRTNGDPLMYLGPLVCGIPIGGNRPLVEDLVTNFLLRYVEHPDPTTTSAEVYQLCELTKTSLFLLDHMEMRSRDGQSTSDRLIRGLSADLDELKRRGSSGGTELQQQKSKKRKHGGNERTLGSRQVAILDVVDKVLRSDSELKGRWPELS